MNYKNLTANLLGLSLPFLSLTIPLAVWFCCRFALHFRLVTTLETRQDRSLDYALARRMTRISAAKIICIHNKLIKSQSPHKATHFRGQLFPLLDIFRFFDFLFKEFQQIATAGATTAAVTEKVFERTSPRSAKFFSKCQKHELRNIFNIQG